MQTLLLDSPHQDQLTCLCYNFTGTCLATASLDHSIYLYAKEGKSGDWIAKEPIKFECPVLRVCFGYGEWENLLAAGLADGTCRIYSQAPEKTFRARATLTEGRGSLRDVAFQPFDKQALKIVTLAADFCIRLYECLQPIDLHPAGKPPNAVSGLASWNLIETIDLANLPQGPCSSQSTGHVSGFSSIASGGPSTSAFANLASTSKISLGSTGSKTSKSALEAISGYSLSWCKETWYGECLAVAAGPLGLIRIFELSSDSGWAQPLLLIPNGFTATTCPPVTSLDWAPACGRSYQLIAAAYKDDIVRLYKLFPSTSDNSNGKPLLDDTWTHEQIAELKEHVGSSGGVSKVEFNVTGTVLSTAGDEVRLWKSTYSGEWRPHAVLTTTEEPEDGNQMSE